MSVQLYVMQIGPMKPGFQGTATKSSVQYTVSQKRPNFEAV